MNKAFLGFIGAAIATTFANAQTSTAVTQADVNRQSRETQSLLRDLKPGDSFPALSAEEEADIGPQMILRQRKHKWFRASVDEQIYYTDNMFFIRNSDIDAGVSVATVEAAVTSPNWITSLASYRAEVGYRHQFFNYFGKDQQITLIPSLRRDDFDFQSSTAFGDILAQTKHYQFRVGLDYTRLLGFEPLHEEDYDDFYREFAPRWSVQRNFRVCDRSQFSVAYLGSYHFTDEDPMRVFVPGFGFGNGFDLDDRSERWEHAAIAAYSVALPCNIVVQPYYRFQYTDYTSDQFDLSEMLHTAGLGVGWYPCENFSVRVFGNYNWNESDVRLRDYEQLNIGGGANVTFRF